MKTSQHKSLTNFDKGKLLAHARKRLGFSQLQMAEKLNLDPTYISQLENGRREVDEFYVERSQELASEFEKAIKVQALREVPGRPAPTPESCLDYMREFLESCTDTAKLGWTAMELKEHFPLDKWARLNSGPDAVAARAAKRAVAGVRRPGVAYGRSRKAASPSGKTSSRA